MSLEQKWQEWLDTCEPKPSTEVTEELRQAFYAGAVAMYQNEAVINAIGQWASLYRSAPHFDMEEFMKMKDKTMHLHNEIRTFIADLEVRAKGIQ